MTASSQRSAATPTVAVAVAVVLVAAAGSTATAATPGSSEPERPPFTTDAPSTYALTHIPADYLAWYRYWTRECPGLPWAVVAGLGNVKSGHGQSRAPGVRAGADRIGRAGPMRFGVGGRAGNTWASYGRDGDGDGRADVHNPADAIRSAYLLLCDHGAAEPGQLHDALRATGHSDFDIDRILAFAKQYRTDLEPGLDRAAVALLNNPRVQLLSIARQDVQDGKVAPRICRLLNTLAGPYTLEVHGFKRLYAKYEPGARYPSSHFFGRAVDISRINGRRVTAANPAARQLVIDLAALSGPLRPDEIGSPLTGFNRNAGRLPPRHEDMGLHVGYDAR